QQIGAAPLNAQTAQTLAGFQTDYLSELRGIFVPAGITIEAASYEDIAGHDVLMSPEPGDLGNLLALGTHTAGINVYFVRSILPAGVQAFGPNPGPAGIAGSRQSGIAIGVDTLCYRSWGQVARLTAHEIARYMGLYHNVELNTSNHPTWRDPIDDSTDSSVNLMYFSESGGTDLSPGQDEVLQRSAVLQ
ncbi:MAG TPA: hypothetical protein VGO00_10980, partial [Kofleriaceae bacterium]|nr:hypothetical protein [Kofleriaceae bacterium]